MGNNGNSLQQNMMDSKICGKVLYNITNFRQKYFNKFRKSKMTKKLLFSLKIERVCGNLKKVYFICKNYIFGPVNTIFGY